MAYLNRTQLKKIGFKSLGRDVQVSEKASFYNPQNISIGDYSRIDDFCILSAGKKGIYIGRNVHIAALTSIIGRGKIFIDDFAGLSSHVSVYSSSDDYSGASMTNPTIPEKYANITEKDVYIAKHCIIGSGSVILPGSHLQEGVAIGALSLVKKGCKKNHIYAGIPAKIIKKRCRTYLRFEEKL